MVLLDLLLHFIHITVIIINATFWISLRTLRVAQVMLVLTTASWFGLGFFYGFGYCFLTDWQWQVKAKLPYSYIKYILDHLTGRDWAPVHVDVLTLVVFLISVFGCAIQTYRYRSTLGKERQGC